MVVSCLIISASQRRIATEQMIKHCATCQANADNSHVSKMCLILINTFSKWPERVVLQSTSAGITVEKLWTIVANKGISEILVSDNDPHFVTGVCNNVVRRYGIRHLQSTLCHPASNGHLESCVEMLYHPARVNMWKRALHKGKFASAQAGIDVVLQPYGNTIHPTTDDVPVIRLYGRALRARLDLLRPEGSVAGAVSRPTLGRDFDVGQPVMEPANCLVQIDD